MNKNERKAPVWHINGLELPFHFDFDDLDSMERYENIFIAMKEKTEQLPKGASRVEQIKAYCNIIFDTFDALFGKGTTEQLFQGKYNMRLCDDMYEKFLYFVSSSVNTSDQLRIAKLQRYAVKKPSDHRKPYKRKQYRA